MLLRAMVEGRALHHKLSKQYQTKLCLAVAHSSTSSMILRKMGLPSLNAENILPDKLGTNRHGTTA